MKKWMMLCGLIFTVLLWGDTKDPSFWRMVRNGVDGEIVLTVVDDQSRPVPDANVHVEFSEVRGLNVVDSRTDSDGKCVLRQRTSGNKITILLSKDGYYDSRMDFSLIKIGNVHEIRNGRWQPWPIEKKIELRKIREPVSLCHFAKRLSTALTNQWLGVDMQLGDFVRPNGSGEVSDFELKIQWDGLNDLKSKLCTTDVFFHSILSGGVLVPKVLNSKFPHVYRAETNSNFISSFQFQDRHGEFYSTHKPLSKDVTCVTRTRCVVDRNGMLKAANYGCIRQLDVQPSRKGTNVVISIQVVFNPTPNDTNLEPKK